jgi:hypothetical protein
MTHRSTSRGSGRIRAIAVKIAAALLLSGTIVAISSAPARADACLAYGAGYQYETESYIVNPNPCYRVESRIFRYYSSTIYTYYGPQSTYSYVYADNGINAGNHYRVQGASGAPWSVWINVSW